jgi:hypothetical protein
MQGSDITISDIYADVIVISEYDKAVNYGGIIGSFNTIGTLTLENLVFAGRVEHDFDDLDASGAGIVGGIVGGDSNQKTVDTLVLRDCVNLGTEIGKTASGAFVGKVNHVELVRCLDLGQSGTNVAANGELYLVGQVRNTTSGSTDHSITIEDVYSLNVSKEKALANVSGLGKDEATLTALGEELNVITENAVTGNAAKTTLANFDFAGTDDAKNDWVVRPGSTPLPKSVYSMFVKLAYVQSGASETAGAYNVRIIAEIDSLDYADAGFKVTRASDGKTLDASASNGLIKVYKTVNDSVGSVTAADGKYFITVTISDISGASEFTVTPYTVTAEGDTVEVKSMTFSYNANGTEIIA